MFCADGRQPLNSRTIRHKISSVKFDVRARRDRDTVTGSEDALQEFQDLDRGLTRTGMSERKLASDVSLALTIRSRSLADGLADTFSNLESHSADETKGSDG